MNVQTRSNPVYQLFMLALCVYAIVMLAFEALFRPSGDVAALLGYADWIVCAFFMADFLATLVRSPHRLRYLATWGWLDFLSSIPMLPALRVGRAARILRIFRVLRGFRATKLISEFVLERRAQSVFLAAAILSILLTTFASIAILQFEDVPGANIKSPEDAFWWAFVTITTVGYGDRFPVTTEGRLVGMVLMTGGVGLFGTFSGFVASWFLAAKEEQQEDEIAAIRDELGRLRAALERPAAGSAPTGTEQ